MVGIRLMDLGLCIASAVDMAAAPANTTTSSVVQSNWISSRTAMRGRDPHDEPWLANLAKGNLAPANTTTSSVVQPNWISSRLQCEGVIRR